MKQLSRDYKNLKLPDYESGFANGFVTALLLMTVVFKLTGLIP
jgi:hypothetical protein